MRNRVLEVLRRQRARSFGNVKKVQGTIELELSIETWVEFGWCN